jgi:Spy/CpxP family protein refolding chaperone
MAKELKEAVRAISALLNDPRVGQGQRDQLLRAQRELRRLAQSGKPNRRRVFRLVQVVATVALEVVAT